MKVWYDQGGDFSKESIYDTIKLDEAYKKRQFYTINEIVKIRASYYVIFGRRSQGKTTSVSMRGIERFIKSGYDKQMLYVRRFKEDLRMDVCKSMFTQEPILPFIKKLSKGKYDNVLYKSKAWYLVKYNDAGKIENISKKPFCGAVCLAEEQRYKGAVYDNIKLVLFDEFLTRSFYLPGEFVTFQNLLSTVIRSREDVEVFMCGNSIDKFSCPYINEMGLTHMREQPMNTIDTYKYGGTTIAVEHACVAAKSKEENKYFAFDNPKLKMISVGGWEVAAYPHLPMKYKPADIILIFYIVFENFVLQGNFISVKDDDGMLNTFIYMHPKTTEVKDGTDRFVFYAVPSPKPYYRTNILKPYTHTEQVICNYVKLKKVFYADNACGEIFNSYLKHCLTEAVVV